MAKKRTSQQIKASVKLKEYRHAYALAKKRGLVKGDKSAVSLKPSRYMKTKLNKLKPYLNDEYKAVKLAPDKARKWRKNPSTVVPITANSVALVKVPKGQRVKKTKQGDILIEEIFLGKNRLKEGTFERIPLPFRPTSLEDLRDWVKNNPDLDDDGVLKYDNEVFNYRIFGHPSHHSFQGIEGLVQYLEGGASGNDDHTAEEWFAEAEFELFRSYKDWRFERDTSDFKRQKRRDRRERWRRGLTGERLQRRLEKEKIQRMARPSYQRQLDKQKEQRKTETPEEREKRLERVRKWKAKQKKKPK